MAGKAEGGRFRKRLAGTIRWGLKLKRALLDEERAAEKEKRREKALFSKQEQESAAALDKARKREMVLSVNLQNATHTAATRAVTLGRFRLKLVALQRDRASLHLQLAAASNDTFALRDHLGQEVTTEAELRQKLLKSNKELATHLKIEKQERKAEAADRQKIASETATIEKARGELLRVRSTKAHEDATLNTTRRELKAAWELAKQHKEAEHAQERRIRELLGKEKAAEERAKLLSQELDVQKKQVLGSRAHEQQMGQLVNALRDNVRREVSNLTWRLGIAEANQKDLTNTNEHLQQLLRTNVTRISHLQTEVSLLKKRVDDGDAARRSAEKAAAKAEDEKVAAEAVSKQLSGTVPRLLEQAQLAHEARDTEKAMRAQAVEAQAAARSEIVNLEQQYTSAVQGQLEQLNQVLPKLGASSQAPSPSGAANTAAPEDLSVADLDNDTALMNEAAAMPPAPVTEDLADAVGRAAAATSVMEQPATRGEQQHKAALSAHRLRSAQPSPDLAKDSQGLGMLLSQDEGEESKASMDAATMVADSSDEG
jgi:DNA repair exonuclease SbcCD ATPase subunit